MFIYGRKIRIINKKIFTDEKIYTFLGDSTMLFPTLNAQVNVTCDGVLGKVKFLGLSLMLQEQYSQVVHHILVT